MPPFKGGRGGGGGKEVESSLVCIKISAQGSASATSELELELKFILSEMAQKPVLRGEVGACVLRVTRMRSSEKGRVL